MNKMDSELKNVIMNSWINRESPTDVSTMAHFKNGGYEDILEPRRVATDISYSFKTRKNVPKFKFNTTRTPKEISQSVLTSDRLNYAIDKIVTESKVDRSSVVAEAQSILIEMEHSFSIRMVRGVAYFLIKIFKSIFNRIYVNREATQMLHKLMKEHPVLLMPTHRSYIDFLVISYIFYEYDLTLPIIATAMDFKDMFIFGWLLRKMGGFYIRRSFGSDKLYWAIFTEYVQSHLRNGDAPVEFFIEGTRSRNAKSYQPKIGMLSASLEAFFKAEVYDIQIVPIAISYERIVEEMLYAFELLGVPKPKESSRGLLKARSILEEDYGSLHFHICDPISIREFSASQIDRTLHSLEPRYINNLTGQENDLMKRLAIEIIIRQQQHAVISPCALIASILMQRIAGMQDLSISIAELTASVQRVRLSANNLAAYVNWPEDGTNDSIMNHYLALHSNILQVTEATVSLKPVQQVVVTSRRDELITRAASCLALASYRNQLMHVFLHVGLVSTVVHNSSTILHSEQLYTGYSFLRVILQKEFIFQPENETKDFRKAVLSMMHSGAFKWPASPNVDDNISDYRFEKSADTAFLNNMFKPFLLSYMLTCEYLLQRPSHIQGRPLPSPPKPLAQQIQKYMIDYILRHQVATPRDDWRHLEVISLSMISNCVSSLVAMKALVNEKREGGLWLSSNISKITSIKSSLGKYITIPCIAASRSSL